MKQKILHIIQRDKFTSGYISFMQLTFPEIQHIFFTQERGFELNYVENADVRFFSDNTSFCIRQKKMIETCDKIIISGLFFKLENQLLQFSKKIWNKIYLHFWGGDFYQYRENLTNNPNFYTNKELLLTCVTNCAGIINLIKNDYLEIKKILSIEEDVNHFVAEMPADPRTVIDFKSFQKKEKQVPYRVFVGNSADSSNRHLEAFEFLSKFKNEDIQIVCPLSYGDEEYRNQVISEGKKIFGNKFLPVTQFYNLFDYLRLLSTASVGIYNNDRQQAMGNILFMLGLGKKIFIKSSTPMWGHFINEGADCNDVENIKIIGFEEFITFDEKSSEKNYQAALNIMSQDVMISHWESVFQNKSKKQENELFRKWHKKKLREVKLRKIELIYNLLKKFVKNMLPYGVVNMLLKRRVKE